MEAFNMHSELSDIKVSFFNSVTDKTPKEISIIEAISIIKSNELLIAINKIRNSENKAERDNLKKSLPSITVSGTFKDGHSTNNLIKHSGLMQVDIDGIEQPIELKAKVSKDIFTYSCFISPSGNGLKAIIKIPTDNHLESFELIQNYFLSEYKIAIDNKCKDIGRLMFLSYDNELFINEKSLIMNETTLKVKNVIEEIEIKQIDITETYENWIKIGFAFANEFKESGRALFHSISRFNIDYNETKCNNQYNECLKSENDKTRISTFFYLVKKKGIEIAIKKNDNKISKEKKENEKEDENQTSKFLIVEKYISKIYDFRYNKVANEIEYKSKEENTYKAFNEDNLYRELQHKNIFFSQSNISSLMRSDFVPQYDPIEQYFETLKDWDNQTDHIINLCSFIKAKDQERFNIHFKKMLVRSVACGLGIAFNKQAFILMGGQSSGKTTFCRWLCPEILKNYYTENINTDKDSQISLTENIIINLDELASMQKADLNALKSILSKDIVKVRRPYDRKPTVAKRRANFFGSTNKDEFLTDETGSVRWLCFEIFKIVWDYKKEIDIDLVWGQAYYLFKNGFKYEMSAEEIEENEKNNSEHTIRTAEFELIQRYFEPIEKDKPFAKHYTATDIINELKVNNLANVNLNIQNIGKALKQLGYERVSYRTGENKMALKGYWLYFNYKM
jgi:predicted P-loop ATPase